MRGTLETDSLEGRRLQASQGCRLGNGWEGLSGFSGDGRRVVKPPPAAAWLEIHNPQELWSDKFIRKNFLNGGCSRNQASTWLWSESRRAGVEQEEGKLEASRCGSVLPQAACATLS